MKIQPVKKFEEPKYPNKYSLKKFAPMLAVGAISTLAAFGLSNHASSADDTETYVTAGVAPLITTVEEQVLLGEPIVIMTTAEYITDGVAPLPTTTTIDYLIAGDMPLPTTTPITTTDYISSGTMTMSTTTTTTTTGTTTTVTTTLTATLGTMTIPTTTTTQYITGGVLPLPTGDIDSDGVIDASDASVILQNYAEKQTNESYEIPWNVLLNGDVNHDGVIDAQDASLVLAYYTYVQTTTGEQMYPNEFYWQFYGI